MYIKYIVKNISDLYNEESKICNYELTESILATAVTVGNCDKTKLECKIIKNTMDGFTSNAAEIGKADSTAYLSGTVTKFTEFNYAITDVLYTYTIASGKTTPFGKIPAKVIKENIKIVWVNNPVFKIDFYDYVERSYEPTNSNWSIYRHKHTIENGEIFNDISNTNDSFKFTFTNNNCLEMCVRCNLQVRGNFKFYKQLQEPLSDFVEKSIDPQYTGYYILPFDISLLYPSLPCQMSLQFKSGSNIPYKVMYDNELDVLNDVNL